MSTDIPDGTEVTVNLPDLQFRGRVVGKASTDITQTHIVECLDGQLPNETYPYKVCVCIKSLLTITE